MKKLLLSLIVIGCVVLTSNRGLSGHSIHAKIQFPEVKFEVEYASSCGYHLLSNAVNANKGYIYFLYKKLGPLLSKKKATLKVFVTSKYSAERYGYNLKVGDMRVLLFKDYEIMDVPDDKVKAPISKKIFYQHIVDNVAKYYGMGTRKITVREIPFERNTYTIQLGAMKNERSAIKLAKKIMNGFGEKWDDQFFVDHENHCSNCMFYEVAGEVQSAPPVFFYKGKDHLWRVSYGLFHNKKLATKEIPIFKKFYKGPRIIKKIKVSDELIEKQIDHRWDNPCPD